MPPARTRGGNLPAPASPPSTWQPEPPPALSVPRLMGPEGQVRGSSAGHGAHMHDHGGSCHGKEVRGRSLRVCGAVGRTAGSFCPRASGSQILMKVGRPQPSQDLSSSPTPSLQESTPLLPEVRQELRSRVRRSSVPSLEDESLEVWDPRESFYDRALRLFQRLLCCLQQKWQAVLAWVRKMVAAGMQALCSAVEAVWSVFQDFCSFVAQVLRSAIQA